MGVSNCPLLRVKETDSENKDRQVGKDRDKGQFSTTGLLAPQKKRLQVRVEVRGEPGKDKESGTKRERERRLEYQG